MKSKRGVFNTALTVIFSLSLVIAIGSNFYRYIYTKQYTFLVEAPCDATLEKCFHRACETSDDCPPNNLSVYKKYTLSGKDFSQCSDNSCKQECESNQIACSVVLCNESVGDTCQFYPNQ
jgi:hypothetical protein